MTEFRDKAAEIVHRVTETVESVIRSEGMEIVDIEYRREYQGMVLRLFIDREGGVSVNDCAKVSRVVGDLLDVSDIVLASYHLEVSSPGLDRVLRKLEHFQEQVGKVVDVRTIEPIEKRRKFKGILSNATSEGIAMNCEGLHFEIPLTLVERARLCYFESLEM